MATKKSKAKEWFTIVGPDLFENRELGTIVVTDPEQLVGRKISMSILELLNNFNKFYVKFIFRIVKVDGTKAYAEFNGSEVMRDYVSRMILKRIRRIDTVQNLETKDGKKIVVKGIATVSKKVKSSIEKTIRSLIKEMLQEEVAEMNFDDFIINLTTDDLKFRILNEVRKIYPVRNFEIRKTQVI
jgi:small subunit ribosomal protein S3Ae